MWRRRRSHAHSRLVVAAQRLWMTWAYEKGRQRLKCRQQSGTVNTFVSKLFILRRSTLNANTSCYEGNSAERNGRQFPKFIDCVQQHHRETIRMTRHACNTIFQNGNWDDHASSHFTCAVQRGHARQETTAQLTDISPRVSYSTQYGWHTQYAACQDKRPSDSLLPCKDLTSVREPVETVSKLSHLARSEAYQKLPVKIVLYLRGDGEARRVWRRKRRTPRR